MGFIDFVKQAGQKIFGVSDDKEVKKEQLVKHVKGLGLPVTSLDFSVDDDVVTVTGTVDSREHAEKIALAVGNVEGVSKVNNQLKVKVKPVAVQSAKPIEQEPEATFYTVKEGDSLSKIAKAQYSDPMKYHIIFEANQPMLKDPDKIYPGQVLRIPPLTT